MNVFDFVKSITETKEDIFENNENQYNKFIINKSLSFNLDCLFIVHELCKYKSDINDKVHYEYLLNSIEKKKRWGKWVKKDSLPEDVELIKEAYGYSDEKALSVLPLFNDKTLLTLKELLDKGGRK
jgi:hypothetical protein